MYYVHKFSSNAQMQEAYNGSGYTEPWLACAEGVKLPTYSKLPDPFNGITEYVDLGLPSKTLWSTKNIYLPDEQTWNSDEERDLFGYTFFSWGEVDRFDGEAAYSDGSLSAYKWYDATNEVMTKYNDSDRKFILDPEDDAAHVIMGGQWSLPTVAQANELLRYTTQTEEDAHVEGSSTFMYGVRFTAGNGNSVFIPAQGYGGVGESWGWSGAIMLKNRPEDDPYSCYLLDVTNGSPSVGTYERQYGFCVRGVIKVNY